MNISDIMSILNIYYTKRKVLPSSTSCPPWPPKEASTGFRMKPCFNVNTCPHWCKGSNT